MRCQALRGNLFFLTILYVDLLLCVDWLAFKNFKFEHNSFAGDNDGLLSSGNIQIYIRHQQTIDVYIKQHMSSLSRSTDVIQLTFLPFKQIKCYVSQVP